MAAPATAPTAQVVGFVDGFPPFVGRRKRPLAAPREVLVELAGCRGDEHFVAVSAALRYITAAFGPLLRVLTATVSHAAAFDAKYARLRSTSESTDTSPRVVLVVDGVQLPLDDALSPSQSAARVTRFFFTDFVGWKMTSQLEVDRRFAAHESVPHPLLTASSGDAGRQTKRLSSDLVVRPYFTETLRRAGYLVGSRATGRAFVVDIGDLDVKVVLQDAEDAGLTITMAIDTHYPRDHLLGTPEIVNYAAHRATIEGTPAVTYIGPLSRGERGVELPRNASGGDSTSMLPVATEIDVLGADFRITILRSRAPWAGHEPASVPDDESVLSVVVSTTASGGGAQPIAAFTGVVLGVDCPGPVWWVDPCNPRYPDAVARLRWATVGLLRRVVDSTVLLPTYGGYSNATHALDLAWLTHVGDARRANVALYTAVNEAADDSDDAAHKPLVAFCRALLGIVDAPLFRAVQCTNRRLASEPWTSRPAQAAKPLLDGAATLLRDVADPARGLLAGVGYDDNQFVVLDLRMSVLREHRGLLATPVPRCSIALEVPMDLDTSVTSSDLSRSRASKKAELWTSTLLHPNDRIVMLIDDKSHAAQATDRINFVTAGHATIAGYLTTNDLASSVAVRASPLGRLISTRQRGGERANSLDDYDETHSLLDPGFRPVPVAASGGAAVPTGASRVAASCPLVVDVRSPYEFRNGSHSDSVHVPLSDLRQNICRLVGGPAAADTLSSWGARLAVDMGAADVERMLDPTLTSRILLYCAGGYRSVVALSLVRAAAQLATTSRHQRGEEEPTNNSAVPPIRVADVSGGALTIMLRHADFWMVKDRNVICVS